MDKETIAVIVQIILIPLGFWFLSRVVSRRDKLFDERQDHICQKIDQLKDDILFQFNNHGHNIKCSNEHCGAPETVGVAIRIPSESQTNHTRRVTDHAKQF